MTSAASGTMSRISVALAHVKREVGSVAWIFGRPMSGLVYMRHMNVWKLSHQGHLGVLPLSYEVAGLCPNYDPLTIKHQACEPSRRYGTSFWAAPVLIGREVVSVYLLVSATHCSTPMACTTSQGKR